MSGIDRIAAERARQVAELGYSPEHDEEHGFGELAGAAAAYVELAGRQIATGFDLATSGPPSNLWRWESDSWKPSPDPIRNLVKAGALIAAEIDRLEREGEEREAWIDANPERCDTCGARFQSSELLNVHRSSHEARPFA